VIFLDILILSDGCAKITVDRDECKHLGIDYESFSPNNIAAKIFLASLLARLETMGVLTSKSQKIGAEIFEDSDGSLIIYICGSGFSKPVRKSENDSVIICNDPESVIKTLKRFSDTDECRLYKYNGKYAIITENENSGKIGDESAILTAKIKEYGKLLSDTPIEKISEL
jgi:hypothetical protein